MKCRFRQLERSCRSLVFSSVPDCSEQQPPFILLRGHQNSLTIRCQGSLFCANDLENRGCFDMNSHPLVCKPGRGKQLLGALGGLFIGMIQSNPTTAKFFTVICSNCPKVLGSGN